MEVHTNKDNQIYIAIDLKSFFASVECVERGLDPLSTNLVVADASRTEKTICLAVSPSLKAFHIPGRARLFEVVQKVKAVNANRLARIPQKEFDGESYLANELEANPNLAVSYITAVPRMAEYMRYSTKIYGIYLNYVAPEDMHVYSIDEVFLDVTHYLSIYKMSAKELAMTIIKDVLNQTGITATAGIGTNMYLCKVAMDVEAKHILPDENGVRIAELDERSYREKLWNHRPISDFWRVGRGYAKKLEQHGLYTMGDIARCSMNNEDILYRMFGVNAELLIDHAWGWEPCTIDLVKQYKPKEHSFSSGQVLHCPYTFQKARVVAHEMVEDVALDLVDKGVVTDQMVLTVGYDIECLTNEDIRNKYNGPVTTDGYGRKVPKHAHGTANIGTHTSSSKLLSQKVLALYDEIVNPNLLIRRLTITTNHVIREADVEKNEYQQMDLFTNYAELEQKQNHEQEELEKERKLQEAMLHIKKKYGKNAILKGVNFEEGATGKDRNAQIGGHKA